MALACTVAALLIAGCTGTSRHPLPASSPRSNAPALPAIGAADYPSGLYPEPVRSRDRHLLSACPNRHGTATVTTAGAQAASIAYTRQFQAVSLASDLRGSDRAWWPEIARAWQDGDASKSAGRRIPILYSGRLVGRWPSGLGAPDPRRWIAAACGPVLAKRSWVVVEGPRNGPALQGAFVFVVRQHHPLLYFTYP